MTAQDTTHLLNAQGRSSVRAARWFLWGSNRALGWLPRAVKQRRTQIFIDAGAAASAVFLAYQFRFDFKVPRNYAPSLWLCIAVMAFLRPATLWLTAGYRTIWRFIRVQDIGDLILVSATPSLLLLTVRFSAHRIPLLRVIPAGVIALEFAMFVALATGVRGFRRAMYEESRQSNVRRRRTLLAGSEESLAGALTEVRASTEVEVVGLVAPGKSLRGLEIGQIPIVARPEELGTVLRDGNIDNVLIVDATLPWIQQVRSTALSLGIAVHTLPSAANVIRGEVRVARQFDVDEAIAERGIHAEPVAKVNEVYVDRVVLVTGAGGSIGSELSRQISKLRIASLILLDNDESSIVEVQNELKDTTATARILPIVGDIRDERLVHHVFTQHSPDIVLHAAGYKHVPVLESNASEAVLNNVIGTRNLRDAALQVNSERFVMVSSDKAVRPSSVMGATKRLAEILIQRRGASAPRTRFACVRFGNVIGSRGSVVPIFLKQIAEGKAITVTDERMSRYFMTMKDAVQLVLQASSLALHGEIYILNMREPIKIIALARTLIEKSALQPDTDVPVRIIGSRPGEKLEEILWEDEAPIAATEFPGVYSLGPGEVPDDFEIQVSQLEQIALNRQDAEVLAMLRCMQIGYRESTEIRV